MVDSPECRAEPICASCPSRQKASRHRVDFAQRRRPSCMDELDRPPLTRVAAMSEAGAAGSTRFWAGVGGNHPDHITPARLPPAASKPSYVHGGPPATQQTTNMASSTVVGELTSARSASLQSPTAVQRSLLKGGESRKCHR